MLKTVKTAMVLCAGFGKRMEELSQSCPKPLLPVWGKPMLDHLLSRLKEAGISRLVVNTHYLRTHIQSHLLSWEKEFSEFYLSVEETLLGIAGGIRQALPFIGEDPFFVLNGDVLFNPTASFSLFEKMEQEWTASTSCLLAVVPHSKAWGYTEKGDFFRDVQGNLTLKTSAEAEAPYVYAGVQLLDPQFVTHTHPSAAYMLPLWRAAQAHHQLKGVIWEGEWFHVGTKATYHALSTS